MRPLRRASTSACVDVGIGSADCSKAAAQVPINETAEAVIRSRDIQRHSRRQSFAELSDPEDYGHVYFCQHRPNMISLFPVALHCCHCAR
jgi:hypothetical protein